MEKEQETTVNPYIFRMYDIRGVVGKDITPAIAGMVGQACGTFLRQSQKGKVQVAVGRDNRVSSPELHRAVCAGLNRSGCDALDLGLTPTPLLNWAVCRWKLGGGINVTGSHNPPDQNGFKLAGGDAYPIAEDDIQALRAMVEGQAFAKGKGKLLARDPNQEYMADVLRLVRLARPVRVVIDAGNGVAGILSPELLRRLGCEVIELCCELDSSFPHHLPNPEKPENMLDLQRRVVETKADIGFAYDGDGDRIGVVNERGERLTADDILILLARDMLARHPGSRVLMDVKSSQSVSEDIKRHGGVPVMWKTGHSLIKRKMREDNIMLAGEFSGHMFVAEDYYTIDDALVASCRLLQVLAGQDKPFSSLLLDLPKRFSTGLIEAGCDDKDKFEVIARVTESFSGQYEVLAIDGARINFGGGWAVVRASNTTPTLTMRFEADSEARLREIQSIVFGELKKFPSVRLPDAVRTS